MTTSTTPARPFQASFGPDSPLLANAAPGDAIEIELSGGGQELHIKDVRLRASQHAHSFTSSLLPPPSSLLPWHRPGAGCCTC